MRDVMRKLLFLLVVFFFFRVIPLRANDIYIAQSATGAANGADCADALAVTYFNTSGNWTSGIPAGTQIGPGTTVHLCGTFTGTAGQTLLTFQGSGASGNPVTLLFESGANLTAPYWGSSGAIHVSGRSWVVIDGGTNGIIQNTANGSGLAYMAQSNGLVLSGVSSVLVKNLAVANICEHTIGDTNTCQTGGNNSGGISVTGGATNLEITKTTVHDAYTCIWYGPSSSDTNVTISYNTLSRCNWEIAGNGGASGPLTITGNDISCVVGGICNYDDSNDNFHHNGIFFFPPNGASLSNMTISNNHIHDINGHTTAYIFLAANGSTGNVPNVLIYNNVFSTTSGQSGPANGMITCGPSISGVKIYNNTMVGPGARGFGADANATMVNNIAEGQAYVEYFDSGASGNTSQYNDFYSWGQNGGWYNGATIFGALASWQSGSTSQCSGGCDVIGSITSNPNLGSAFVPASGSPAIGTGKNLSSLGIAGLNSGAPQYFGVNYACGNGCVPRSGTWDMGAYQTVSQSGGSQPNPPTNLKATVQ